MVKVEVAKSNYISSLRKNLRNTVSRKTLSRKINGKGRSKLKQMILKALLQNKNVFNLIEQLTDWPESKLMYMNLLTLPNGEIL
jgi:hypothetical protein